MQIITINLSEKYLSAIQILKDFGSFASRSEAIRIALRDFLTRELEFFQDLDDSSLISSLKTRKERRIS